MERQGGVLLRMGGLDVASRFNWSKEFFRVATDWDGAHDLAKKARPSLASRIDLLMEVSRKYFSTSLNQRETAEFFQIKGNVGTVNEEWVRDGLRRMMILLTRHCHPLTREHFGEHFFLRKPYVKRHRMKISRIRTTVSAQVVKEMRNGRSYAEISNRTGFSNDQIRGAVYRARRAGKLGLSDSKKYEIIEQALKEPPADFDSRQSLLNQVSFGFFRKHRHLFLSVQDFFSEVGSRSPHYSIGQAVEGLRAFGIPCGQMEVSGSKRTFVLKSDVDNILNVLNSASYEAEKDVA